MRAWPMKSGPKATANTRDFPKPRLFFGWPECSLWGPRFVRLTDMPKSEFQPIAEVRSAFFERRRLRRIRMIVELTRNLISSDLTVSHREAQCLVNCARKAILDLHPEFADRYERIIRPHFERILAQRWPAARPLEDDGCGVVN
jgi:hypothetical protein